MKLKNDYEKICTVDLFASQFFEFSFKLQFYRWFMYMLLKSNNQSIMLSHTPKGHDPIALCLITVVILHHIMTSLTLCCELMALPISLCHLVLSVNLLLALSVHCEFNNGSRVN